jgi:hypothetical protein
MKTLIVLVLLASLTLLTGCASLNSGYSAALTQGVADYASAKQNVQATDDMKLKVFVDSSCAINIGALQRAVSSTGSAAVANGVFTLCPVPGVGVTTPSQTGTLAVQTFNIPITGNPTPPEAPVSNAVVTPIPAPVVVPVAPKPVAKKVLPKPAPVVPTVTTAPVPTPVPTPLAPALNLPSALPGQ